jgi:hypothetical protein
MERDKKELCEKLSISRYILGKWMKELNIIPSGRKTIDTSKFQMVVPVYSEDTYELLKLRKHESESKSKEEKEVINKDEYLTREQISELLNLSKSATNDRLSNLDIEYKVKGIGSKRFYNKSQVIEAFGIKEKSTDTLFPLPNPELIDILLQILVEVKKGNKDKESSNKALWIMANAVIKRNK